MTDILILLLKPMMYFLYYLAPGTRSYLRAVVLSPIALVGLLADIIVNNTTVPFVLGHGWGEEWTFSTRLERLCSLPVEQVPDQQLYIEIAKKINRVCPTHDHIKAV